MVKRLVAGVVAVGVTIAMAVTAPAATAAPAAAAAAGTSAAGAPGVDQKIRSPLRRCAKSTRCSPAEWYRTAPEGKAEC
jgi:hypothetical protein